MNIQDDLTAVDEVLARAAAAQKAYEAGADQTRYDRAAQAAAWAIMEPTRNKTLAELAVKTTGLGNVPDKIIKNHRKTLGLMRDISTAKTCGVVSDDPATGITEIARPLGVIGAVVPSTNPAATPANNIINALKGGNSIVVAPSPKGVASCELLLKYRIKGKNPTHDGRRQSRHLHWQPKQRRTRPNLRHTRRCGGRRQRHCHRR